MSKLIEAAKVFAVCGIVSATAAVVKEDTAWDFKNDPALWDLRNVEPASSIKSITHAQWVVMDKYSAEKESARTVFEVALGFALAAGVTFIAGRALEEHKKLRNTPTPV